MRVRARGRDLAELRGKLGGGAIRTRLGPRVVRLDDVDAIGEVDDALAAKVRSVAVERMREIREAAHLVNEVHRLLRSQVRGHASRDEKSDELTLSCLRLFADDGQLWSELRQLERAFGGVVIGQRDAIEAAFASALDQCVERGEAVVRIARMEMQVDSLSWRRRAPANSGIT